MINTMVAIFLAKVSRAISGRMPLANNSAWNSAKGPGLVAATIAAPLKIFFRS